MNEGGECVGINDNIQDTKNNNHKTTAKLEKDLQ